MSFQKRLGVTPRFQRRITPEDHCLAERGTQTLQNTIVKLAGEHHNNWTAYLRPALWYECKIYTTNPSPFTLTFGYLPNGPLSILRQTWIRERELLTHLKVDAAKYLVDLHENLQSASDYASTQCEAEQNKYVHTYNKGARGKSKPLSLFVDASNYAVGACLS